MAEGINYPVYLALWHDALASGDKGIAVAPEDGDLLSLRMALYKAREKAKDIRLHDYMVFISPDETEVWICKKQMSP